VCILSQCLSFIIVQHVGHWNLLIPFFPNFFQTISKPVEHPSELPKWNYDGSSTGQAPGEDSEVIL
jgi:hypothetical protein